MKKTPLNIHTLPARFNCLEGEGEGATQLREQGVVFWHPVGVRAVAIFRKTFGDVFEAQCRA